THRIQAPRAYEDGVGVALAAGGLGVERYADDIGLGFCSAQCLPHDGQHLVAVPVATLELPVATGCAARHYEKLVSMFDQAARAGAAFDTPHLLGQFKGQSGADTHTARTAGGNHAAMTVDIACMAVRLAGQGAVEHGAEFDFRIKDEPDSAKQRTGIAA